MVVSHEGSWVIAFVVYVVASLFWVVLFFYRFQVVGPFSLGTVFFLYIGCEFFFEFEVCSGGVAVEVVFYDFLAFLFLYFFLYCGGIVVYPAAVALGILCGSDCFGFVGFYYVDGSI
ncbi:hypothetical protein [Butyrivibrio proteoclasticus]|uniref:hypothetical protein n=1 Tax=Butyrivibrio proteoclasticus TaxID=43305 RepID=UPI00047C4718|nr:hypothetical protein [Butyrivibrio proteoclasticus]